jgi:predicted permease
MYSTILQSLAPVFLMIALGAGLRSFKFLPEPFFAGLNKLAFWVALPALLFLEIARTRAPGGEIVPVLKVMLVVMFTAIALAWVCTRLIALPAVSRSAFIQGSFRANIAYVGLPSVIYAMAHNPAAAGQAALIIASMTPIYNILGVLVLQKRGEGDLGLHLRQVARSIATNPLIIACVLGLIAHKLRLDLPLVAERTLRGIGGAGLPAALMALGAGLSIERVKGHLKAAFLASLIRVAGAPLLGWSLLTSFGVTGDLRVTACLLLACPTAVATYVMADQMGADKDLASAIVVLSTLLAFPAMITVLLVCR